VVSTGKSDTVTVAAGETNVTIDAGFYQVASLATTFGTINANGVQDAGESGIPDVPYTFTTIPTH